MAAPFFQSRSEQIKPIAGLPEKPNIVGSHFATKGIGKYYNPRNVNGQQFNTTGVKQAVEGGVRAHTRAQYFRRAGFGAAMRYTLGMEQVPSHVSDYLNSRTSGQRQTGLNPTSRRWVQDVVHPESDQYPEA